MQTGTPGALASHAAISPLHRKTGYSDGKLSSKNLSALKEPPQISACAANGPPEALPLFSQPPPPDPGALRSVRSAFFPQ